MSGERQQQQEQGQQRKTLSTDETSGGGVIPYDQLLNFLNDAGTDDEGTLVNVFDRDAVDELPDPSTVTASVYKPQKYYRRDDHGNVSFYVAWTLFVAFADGTIKCWMKASDVLEGIGYDTVNLLRTLRQYTTNDGYVFFNDIRQLFFPHQTPQKC